MLAVLSPAKNLNTEPVTLALQTTEPVHLSDATKLMKTTRGLTQKRIRELMHLSPDLAKLNYDRFRSFELPFDDDNALPAALMFNGDVYQGLSARTLAVDDLHWSQKHVAIISGLFGLLRPLDRIQPYRLEMGTRLKTRRGATLYEFWGDALGKRVQSMLADHEDSTLVNLASAEYFKAVRAKRLKIPTVQCVFHDWKDQQKSPNVISFLAKRARGLMARFAIENRIDRASGLRDFNVDRYRFQPKQSDETTWVFGRRFVSALAE